MTRMLRDGLRARGHDVTVVERASCNMWTRVWTRLAGMPFRLFGPVVRLWREYWKYYFQVKNGCQRNRKTYDVIHAQDLGSAAAARRVFPGIPILTTCHFNDHPVPEMLKQTGCENEKARILWRVFDRLFAENRHYHCVSHYVAQKIQPYLPQGADVHVIHNGIDPAPFRNAEASAELRNLARGRKVILNVGSIEPRKNQRFFLQLVPHLSEDCVVCLIGDGPELANLKRIAVQKGLNERIIFAGERRDVANWMQAADLYFHTALNENCPVTLLEAMACGLPTAAFAVGGIPEILNYQDGSLIDSETSIERVAHHLTSLLDSEESRKTIRAHQAVRVDNTFSEERMIDQLENIYLGLANH